MILLSQYVFVYVFYRQSGSCGSIVDEAIQGDHTIFVCILITTIYVPNQHSTVNSPTSLYVQIAGFEDAIKWVSVRPSNSYLFRPFWLRSSVVSVLTSLSVQDRYVLRRHNLREH